MLFDWDNTTKNQGGPGPLILPSLPPSHAPSAVPGKQTSPKINNAAAPFRIERHRRPPAVRSWHRQYWPVRSTSSYRHLKRTYCLTRHHTVPASATATQPLSLWVRWCVGGCGWGDRLQLAPAGSDETGPDDKPAAHVKTNKTIQLSLAQRAVMIKLYIPSPSVAYISSHHHPASLPTQPTLLPPAMGNLNRAIW